MSRAIIPAWVDRQGRVWLDTGQTHRDSREPIIELLNGEAKGSLGWVTNQFGPLESLSINRPKNGTA
ncbi:hypothetical protein [Nonomuraea sp. 10N515B]|uniref:hypothetical protein n=1 Tax=Nonomuraea sp. 10N515B TaxID=3457422 RepID=UPI003FCCAF22